MNEPRILESLRAAIACVYGGLPHEALRHVDDARRELERARIERGLAELRDSRSAWRDEA